MCQLILTIFNMSADKHLFIIKEKGKKRKNEADWNIAGAVYWTIFKTYYDCFITLIFSSVLTFWRQLPLQWCSLQLCELVLLLLMCDLLLENHTQLSNVSLAGFCRYEDCNSFLVPLLFLIKHLCVWVVTITAATFMSYLLSDGVNMRSSWFLVITVIGGHPSYIAGGCSAV